MERYTNEKTGESTPHAEKVATSYERVNLLTEVTSNLPDRATLTMPEYKVQNTDTKGVLKILQDKLGGNHKLKETNFLRLSYNHMFKQNKEINTIEPEDKVTVKNGKLTITRKPGSRFHTFTVDIYPWTQTSAPLAPAVPTPTAKPPVSPPPYLKGPPFGPQLEE